MKKRFALSMALAAALSTIGTSAVLAQDEATDAPGPPPMPDLADFGAVNVSSDVAGESIEHWAQEMQIWMNGPVDQNALATGDCNVAQGGPVFFLQNTWLGETIIGDCTIPADAYILAMPGGGFGFNTEPDETPEGLYDFARDMGQFFSDPELIVDGQHVPVGPASWVQADSFDFTVPENNTWDYPPGVVTANYNGWFVMLEPLEPGEHTIMLVDDSSGPVRDENGETVYTTGTAYAAYRITVPDDGAAPADAEADDAASDDEAETSE